MRIAFFTDTYLPQVNGVTKTIKKLRSFLKNKNIENIVLAPEDPSEVPEEGVFTFSSFPLPFYPEMRLGVPWDKRVDDTMAAFRPDVVHLVTEYPMGLSGLWWAQKTGTPIVASYHTNIPEYLMYYHFPFLSGSAWYYLAWFHNQCGVNFCPSQATKAMLESKGFKNVKVWGRGVNTGAFNPWKRDLALRQELCEESDGLVLLYAGRLAPEKNLDVLTNAYSQVKRYYPHTKLVIAGDGPLASKLMQEAPHGVIFTGKLSEEELAVYYASGDIFTFPSTSETYGNVVLEAMASGLPVVAPMCGGIGENLQPGINGLDFRPHNSQDMAKAIIKLIEDEELRRQMRQNARRHAEGRTWDHAFAPLLEGYYNNMAAKQQLKAV